MDTRNFWVGVVSRAHIEQGVKDGFLQLNHGEKAPVRRMNKGDGVVIYSPRVESPDGEALQKSTAIGTVATGEVYQVEISPISCFRPTTRSFIRATPPKAVSMRALTSDDDEIRAASKC